MNNPISPLTDTHLSQIQSGLAMIEQAEHQVTLAKQAGVDVASAENQLTAAKSKLLQLKRTYFPNS